VTTRKLVERRYFMNPKATGDNVIAPTWKTDILVEPDIAEIAMPENLRVGRIVSDHRKECQLVECEFDYYGFAFGQSPFPVPEPLAQGLAAHADKGKYAPSEGIPELRRAIAGFNQRHFGLEIDPDRVIVGHGSKDLIHSLFRIIQGDVIIPTPAWIGYAPQINLLGKQLHLLHRRAESNYKIDADVLERYLEGLPRQQHILILNNPNNPTGAVYSEIELKDIADVCRRYSTLILADEIYALTTYEVSRFQSMALIYPEGTFVTNGLSKDRSAGGYRLGYCILPDNQTELIRKSLTKIIATTYTNVTTPIQYAAISAFEPNEEIEEYFRLTREIHRIMGSYLSEECNKIEGIKATAPESTFYFFLDFNELSSDLKRKGVMTSNDLGASLISHPFHFAAVTGDGCMLEPDNYGARIAFVDYDGEQTLANYKQHPPHSKSAEIRFVQQNAAKMIEGVTALEEYVQYIRSPKE
jgi:aspartate aminotransferase